MEVRKGGLLQLEGIDGSGKTTQASLLKNFFGPFAVLEPEPTKNTDLGRWLRRELKERRMPNRDLQNYFIADRVGHFERLNRLMENGITVIMDRGPLSTAAYGAATGHFTLKEVLELHEHAMIPKPDILFFLNITEAEAERRRQERQDGKERFDDADFQRKLAELYKELRKISGFNWIDIDADGSVEDVHSKIVGVLRERGLLKCESKTAGQAITAFGLIELLAALDESCRVPLERMVVERYMSLDKVSWIKVSEPPKAIGEAAEILSGFFEKLTVEVAKLWFADHLTNRDVYILLSGEAGELGEYLVKERRDGKRYREQIAAEAVDLLFYLTKVIADAKIDVGRLWRSMAFNISRQEELVLFGNQSAETISQSLGFICARLGALSQSKDAVVSINAMLDTDDDVREREVMMEHIGRAYGIDNDDLILNPKWSGRLLTFDFETGAIMALYLTLKLMDRLDINLEEAWPRKMKENTGRFKALQQSAEEE